MSPGFIPAHAARTGYSAAVLASKGFACSDTALEAPKGFVEIFSSGADLERAVDGLGRHFELLANAYKPYPCGIVIHPVVDACLELAGQLEPGVEPARVALQVHPLALTLTNRPKPTTPLEAQISLYHWAAACFVHRIAGPAQLRQECIDDPAVAALRARVSAVGNPALQRDQAIAEVTLPSGSTLRAHVTHARGSIARPMTDAELDAKFAAQARSVLSESDSVRLLALCRKVSALENVGQQIAAIWAS
jgi:2-methylcitrate dehydratase PrpD